jgi:hypothetical protein
MHSFPMSVAELLCDKLLLRYLDPKTVLIYCPLPVLFLDCGLVPGFSSMYCFSTEGWSLDFPLCIVSRRWVGFRQQYVQFFMKIKFKFCIHTARNTKFIL